MSGMQKLNLFDNDLALSQCMQIFNQDCTEGLKELKDDSIDFIVTDPPYF